MSIALTKAIALVLAVAAGVLFSPGFADRSQAPSAWASPASASEPRSLDSDAAVSPQESDGDDTPSCTTHPEYDRISLFQTPEVVENIVGNDGWFIQTPNPDSFARGYRSCFAPGERFVKVWFEQDNRSSYDKAIVDVN